MTADRSPGAGLHHATVVEIDGRGVIIRGRSGSGKTALAIELLFRCRTCGIASALVADDQVFLAGDPGSAGLVAAVPARIAGLIELRGFGVAPVGETRHKARAELCLSVALVDHGDAERVADPDRHAILEGRRLPELALPEQCPVSSAYAVLGWLGLSPRVI